MKKVFLLLALLSASVVSKADPAFSIVYTPARLFMQGDGFTTPLAAASNNAVYFAMFDGNTVATMAAATGVSLTATFKLPTSMKTGQTMTWGITAMYSAVTNSAVLSGTAKVQSTTYADSAALTITAVTVTDQIQLTDASLYGRPTEITMGSVPSVYPGNVVTVYLERITGTNSLVYIYEVWCKVTPTKGWW
jgi:hypothetical protein